MGGEIHQVSAEIGSLRAQVDGLRDDMSEHKEMLSGITRQLHELTTNQKETRAKIMGLGAGLGLAGGGAVTGIKAVIERFTS